MAQVIVDSHLLLSAAKSPAGDLETGTTLCRLERRAEIRRGPSLAAERPVQPDLGFNKTVGKIMRDSIFRSDDVTKSKETVLDKRAADESRGIQPAYEGSQTLIDRNNRFGAATRAALFQPRDLKKAKQIEADRRAEIRRELRKAKGLREKPSDRT